MKLGRIVGIIVAVLVLIIGGGVAYLASLDVDEYREQIAQAAKTATGRDLKLEGPLSLSVSLTPTVSGEGISLANAPWGSKPQMLSLRRFEVQLQLLPLLFGGVEINRLILIEPDILLETNAEGVGNWVFQPASAAQQETAADGGTAAIPHIGDLLIENGLLTYRDGASGKSTKIKLTRVKARAASIEDPLQLDVQAAYNDTAVKLNGSLGPLKNALVANAPLQIDLTAESLGLTSKLKGTAKVAGKMISLSDLRLALGNSDLSGSLNLDSGGKLPKLTADLSGKRLDLTELQALASKGGAKKAGPAKASARPGKVIPAEALPLQGLNALEADVKLSMAEVVTPRVNLHQVSVAATLQKGRLSLKPMALAVAGSPVKLSAAVDAGQKVASVAFEMAAPKLDVGRLLTETKTTDLVQGTGSLAVKLAGRGNSLAAIAASLNGDTKLLMNQGKVKTEAFDAAIGGLSALVGMLSAEKSEWTVLNCVASRFEIKNGVATSQVLLADTEYSTVVGEGKMDLGQETLAMKVSPQSKSATLNVAVPIKIGGTFAEPTFRPDELATARRLGGLLGATLFPPMALLALGDMGSDDDNPCLKIAKGGGGKAAAKPEQPAASGVQDAVKAPMDSLKKGLDSLFGKK